MADEWAAFRAAPAASDPWATFRAPASPVAGRFPASDEALKEPPVSVGEDVAKSGGIGLAKGVIAGAGAPADFRNLAASGAKWAFDKLGMEKASGALTALQKIGGEGATSSRIQKEIVEPVTGEFYKPKTTAGGYSQSVGEALGNPLSYVGPGGLALKVGGAATSAVGAETGKQLTKGTDYEGAGQLAGALIGGGVAAKTLAPKIERAVVPTAEELKAAATKGYDAARNSGVELDPGKFGTFAAGLQNELTSGPKYAFTGEVLAPLPKLSQPLSPYSPPQPVAKFSPPTSTHSEYTSIISRARQTDSNPQPTPKPQWWLSRALLSIWKTSLQIISWPVRPRITYVIPNKPTGTTQRQAGQTLLGKNSSAPKITRKAALPPR